MRPLGLIVLASSICVFSGCSKPPRTRDAAAPASTLEARLQQIPPADAQKYAAIRDLKTWRNPYLIVTKDGISLFDVSNNEERPLKPNQVLDALASLPASAWPYGRVVAVQESGARGSDEDRIELRRNRAVLAGTLEEAKVLINWVPSA